MKRQIRSLAFLAAGASAMALATTASAALPTSDLTTGYTILLDSAPTTYANNQSGNLIFTDTVNNPTGSWYMQFEFSYGTGSVPKIFNVGAIPNVPEFTITLPAAGSSAIYTLRMSSETPETGMVNLPSSIRNNTGYSLRFDEFIAEYPAGNPVDVGFGLMGWQTAGNASVSLVSNPTLGLFYAPNLMGGGLIPEPASLALLATGAAGLLLRRRKS
jgi:hypothetical protein